MRVDLRHAHPMFAVSLIGDLIAWIGIGLTMTFGPDQWVASTAFDPARALAPMRVWGCVFLLIGAGLIYGVLRSWRWARRSMTLGAAVVAGFAASFIAATVEGHNPGVTGIFMWTAFAANLLAQSGEPPSNPANAR